MIVENRPAGAGQIGMDFVAKAAPDGYTLMVNSDAAVRGQSASLQQAALRFRSPISSRSAGSASARRPWCYIPRRRPIRSQLIAYAKTRPGALNYGTFGIGTSGHLNIIHLENETGTKFTPVHYRGAAPAITDLLGGHIQMMTVAIGLLRQNIEAGKLKAIAIGSRQRLPQYPDLPTLSESGLPNFEAGSWYGLAAPKDTPREIVDKLSTETQKIFADPAFREKFLDPAVTFSIASPPEQFAERIRADLAKWGKVIKDANLKVE